MTKKNSTPDGEFSDRIRSKENQKLRARDKGRKPVWFGLGLFGMVGWAVAVPTLIGTFLGVWIDGSHPGRYSWTLMLLFLGLVSGCIHAWFWIGKEREAIFREREELDG